MTRPKTVVLSASLVSALCLAASCTSPPASTIEIPDAGTAIDDPATDGIEARDDPDIGPIGDPVRHPFTARSIYFVIPDRFDNGDRTNDTGGLVGGPLETGLLPTDTGFHHGGDLAGLTRRLDYIAGMGFTSIWITPPFTNRAVQGGGSIENSSSSYHGYWQVDWTRIDPHLGTEQEMQDFIQAAHQRGIAVIFDAVVNHTGDVISFAEDSFVYRSTSASPYLDATGAEFDPAEVAESAEFPELDPAISFPYTPTVDPALADVKAPRWLNDPVFYHNRGNSTFQGESSLYGDFFGLDDLFTEHPRVVKGMIDIYGDIIDRYKIDGFRVDTMKHVDLPFWQKWAPAMLERAKAAGRPNFFLFGEVNSTDPILSSSYTNVGVPATLDFGFNAAVEAYVTGGSSGDVIAQAFDEDDWFTDNDNNSSMQVTFFGNHDAGRMGAAIARSRPAADDAELVARMKLGFNLNFLTRGSPVVYYGDEQGFTGDGGDQLARQSMFPSVTPGYVDDEQIGADTTPADDNFNPGHPLYRHLADLNQLRTEHPTFVTGAQIVHPTDGPIVGFSRFDRDERVEYLVVTNANGSLTVPARFSVMSPSTDFTTLWPTELENLVVTSDGAGEIFVEMPPLTTLVLKARSPLALPDPATAEPSDTTIIRPAEGTTIPTPRYRIEAELEGDARYVEVTFAVSVDGEEPTIIGVDDAAPYRVYWNTQSVADGARVEIMATVNDGSGRLGGDRVVVTMGSRP